MPVGVGVPVPPLTATVTVTACAIVMLDEDGVTDTEGVAIPLPLSVMVCGLFPALSVNVIVPLRCPIAMGEKTTEISHADWAARVMPHVLVEEKSPVAVIEEMVSEAVPALSRVIGCAVLELPKSTLPKLSDEAERVAFGVAATIGKESALDVPPPGAGLVTVT